MKSALLSIATVLVLISGCGSSSSDFLPDAGITVRPGESIQAAVDAAAAQPTVEIAIDLGLGEGHAVIWASDLSKLYVELNAEYTT